MKQAKCILLIVGLLLPGCQTATGEPFREAIASQAAHGRYTSCRYVGMLYVAGDTVPHETSRVCYSRARDIVRVERVAQSGATATEWYTRTHLISRRPGDTAPVERPHTLREIDPLLALAPLVQRVWREGEYRGQETLDDTGVAVYRLRLDERPAGGVSVTTVAFTVSGLPYRIEQCSYAGAPDEAAETIAGTAPAARLVQYPIVYDVADADTLYLPRSGEDHAPGT